VDEDQEEGTALPDRRTRIDGPPLLLPPLPPSPWRGTVIAVVIVAAVAAAIACAAAIR
jgi:hypothetical protein